MCSGDKLILTWTGMNTLVNLLKGLMGPRDKPPLSILSCLWPNVPRTAVRGRLVFRPGWQVIAQLDMWNRRVCWRVRRLRACYSSNEMSSFHVFQVFIVQATVKQENFDWQLETTFCVSHYVTSFFGVQKRQQPGIWSAWKWRQCREEGLCYLYGIFPMSYWTNKAFLMQH